MSFELPKLPYELDALEPYMSKTTLEFHYGKHHQTYVTNLNNLVVGTPFENADLETIVLKSEGGIFNNGAQVWNHTFFFNQFSATPASEPTGKLKEAIDAAFGSFDAFKEKFTAASVTLFGAGWAWLVVNGEGKLEIVQRSNAGNPLKDELKPILTCDVWEHAYYLDKQNLRAAFVGDFWKIVDWKVIESRF